MHGGREVSALVLQQKPITGSITCLYFSLYGHLQLKSKDIGLGYLDPGLTRSKTENCQGGAAQAMGPEVEQEQKN